LWSSITDEELIRQAAAGKLHESSVLQKQQTVRHVTQPKSLAVSNFGPMAAIETSGKSVAELGEFPDFDDNLGKRSRVRRVVSRETPPRTTQCATFECGLTLS